MALERELRRIKEEAEKEAERAEARRAELLAIVQAQKNEVVSQWSKVVPELLDQLARTYWREDSYALIHGEPDPHSVKWIVARQLGEEVQKFSVTLRLPTDLAHPRLATPQGFLAQSSFVAIGATIVNGPLSQTAIEDALKEIFQTGPNVGGPLEEWAEKRWTRIPYKHGEFDYTGRWLNKFAWASAAVGFLLSRYGQGIYSFAGLLMLLGTPIAMGITHFGKRFRRLPLSMKVAALAGVLPAGALVGSAILVGIVALWLLSAILGAVDEESKRQGKIDDMAEAFRRARRKW